MSNLTSISDAEKDRLCCESISTYLFDNVWNEPFSEYRVNIKPQLIRTASYIGSLGLRESTVPLPTQNESYYVWGISGESLNIGLQLPVCTWVDGATICNEYRTLLNMYGINGAMFSKSCTYFRYDSGRNVLLIAATKKMVTKCIPIESLDKVYFTIYYDSDRTTEVECASIYFTNLKDTLTYQAKIDSILSKSTRAEQYIMYVDGVEVTDVNNPPTATINSYIDIILDTNIEFDFTVTVTQDSENPVYLSTRDKLWKQLIHIPRNLNPENNIYTHNTCDFYIRRHNSDEVHGYYMHRIMANCSVTQVTHNDMSIPLMVIDAYRDYLAEQNVDIRVVVRKHDKNNKLIRDANFIDLLYADQHTDDDIINILTGKGPKDITWWTADHLEQSRYVEMMFDTPNVIGTEQLEDYVNALGYYQVINLLCRRIATTTLDDKFNGTLTFNLPVLFLSHSAIPVVYLNKRALKREYFDYVSGSDNTLSISISSDIVTKPDDVVTVIFYITADNKVYTFTPTETVTSYTCNYSTPIVYVEENTYQSVESINDSFDTKYTLLKKGTSTYVVNETDDGKYRITVSNAYIGKRIVIFNSNCSYLQTVDLSSFTSTGKTIVIPATVNCYNETDVSVPILGFSNVSVYMNGAYLVRDIDYFIHDVTEDKGICSREVVIQTMDHFNESGSDTVDIIYNVAEIEDISSGYVVNDTLTDKTPVNLYFPNISMTHVAGNIERDVEVEGAVLKVPSDTYAEGDLFEIQTSLPNLVTDFVLKYATNQDLEKIKVMHEYFYDLIYTEPSVLILESKHRVYSVFMNKLIWDIVQGNFELTNDPDNKRFVSQIRNYLYLKDIDLVFGNLNQNYVDYYPQYVNYEVSVTQKKLIDRLILTLMPVNQNPTLEVVYEND